MPFIQGPETVWQQNLQNLFFVRTNPARTPRDWLLLCAVVSGVHSSLTLDGVKHLEPETDAWKLRRK